MMKNQVGNIFKTIDFVELKVGYAELKVLHLEHVADADDEGDFVAKVGICYCYGDGSDE